MQVEDSLESARQACLKQVFGGPLSPEEGEQVLRFLATEEGRDYLRQSEEMKRQLKEVAEIRPKPVDAAEMTRRFEGMIRERVRTALRMTRVGALGLGVMFAMGLAMALQGGRWTYRGWFMSASAAFFVYVLFALRKKNRALMEDPDLIHSLRLDQELARKFRTRVNGWVFLGLVFSGMALSWYLDVGSKGLLWVLGSLPFGVAITDLQLRWHRRKDRELWDWWEGKSGSSS
jgi:hypothetical protein